MRPTRIMLASVLLLTGYVQADGVPAPLLDLQLPTAYQAGCGVDSTPAPDRCGLQPLALLRPQARPPETAPAAGHTLGRPWLQELIRGTVCTIANARYCAARDIPDYSTVRRAPNVHDAG